MGSKEQELNLNIVMLGGRRTGKTSVLSGMLDCYEKYVEKKIGINLTSEDDTTLTVLEDQTIAIGNYFNNKKYECEFPLKDINLTSGTALYSFELKLKGKTNDKITLNFHDVKGEKMEQTVALKSLLEDSDVLIICVDTPHLMSEFAKKKNNIVKINQGIKKMSDHLKSKLILFIPTKCEYCYNKNNDARPENGMISVIEKIKELYNTTIDNLKENENEIAIIPVKTIGTIEFSRFEKKDGEIELDDFNLPINERVKYIYKGRQKQEYRPENLELIIFFILFYALVLAKNSREKEKSEFWGHFFRNISNFFKEKFSNFASVEDFIKKLEEIEIEIKNKKGIYEVIADPFFGIFTNKK